MTQDIAVVAPTEDAYVAWCADEGVQPYRGRTRRIRRPFDLLGMPPSTWLVELGRPAWWVVADHEEYLVRKEALDASVATQADPT